MDEKKFGITIGIIILVLLVLIMAFSVGSEEDEFSKFSPEVQQQILNAQEESAAIEEDEMKEFTEIDIDGWYQYIESDERVLVLAASPTCSYCQVAEPIIKHIMYQYNIDIKYIDVSKFDQDTLNRFLASDESFQDEFGTPVLFLLGEKQVLDVVDGLTDTAHYKSFLETYGYI